MINRIKKLTKIFLKDYYQNLNIFNKKNNKLNKKSIYFWLIIIIIACISYISLESILYFNRLGEPILFLKIYLPIIATVSIFQLIMLISSVFYYSQDIKNIIYLPIKPTEIVISKFNTVIVIMYFMESLLLLIPLLMYGILIQKTIMYFIGAIISLAIFPILFTLIIGIITIILMQLSKIINKDLLQLIIIFGLIMLLSLFVTKNIGGIINQENITNIKEITINDKLNKINNNFIIINPIINLLINNNFKIIVINFSKLILLNIFAFIIFIFIGTKLYLKELLIILDNKSNIKKINKKYKFKKENKIKKYIKKDIKNMIKSPTFFIQNILQYIFIAILFIIILNIFFPIIVQQIDADNMIEKMGLEEFKLQATLISVAIIQILFVFSNLSITAISREGKNAIFMKHIPISLYKQIKIKALPQMIINTIIILAIIIDVYFQQINIQFIYLLFVFITSMLINIINSYLLVLVDLNKPNLNWTNQESITKNSGNKLYQYVITIITFLILNYFVKILKNISYIKSMIIINIIFFIIFIIIKKYIKNNIKKIFKKIY